MAEILGLGLTHYPPLCLPDADMAGILRWTLQDPSIPEREKDAAHWPAAMRAEWSDDFGARAAAAHRKQLVAGFEHVRAALDAFQPDVVVIWGDDQYENFKEDVIPPFAILAYDAIYKPYNATAPAAGSARFTVKNVTADVEQDRALPGERVLVVCCGGHDASVVPGIVWKPPPGSPR